MLGSLGQYDRREVKDALAHTTLLVNPSDAQAFRGAIESRRRGAGPTTAGPVLLARASPQRRPARRVREP